jgi:hypothetical protein
MYRYDRAQAIVLAAQHHLQFLPLEFDSRLAQRGFGLMGGFRAAATVLLGHRKIQPGLVERGAQALESCDLLGDAVVFLERGLGGFGTVPEAGLAGLFQQFFVAGLEASDVKDASRACRCASRSRLAVHGFR